MCKDMRDSSSSTKSSSAKQAKTNFLTQCRKTPVPHSKLSALTIVAQKVKVLSAITILKFEVKT